MIGRNVVLATLTLVVWWFSPGDAQQITSPYRFLETRQAATGFAGYLAASDGSLELGPRGAAVLGGRYNLIVSGPLALEAEIGYFASTRAVLDTVPGDTTRQSIGEADFTIAMASGALRLNLTGARTYRGLLPYVLFGLGAAIDFSDASPLDAELPPDVRFEFGTSFTGVLGGGIEWLAGPRLAVRLDARNLLWKVKTPRAFLAGEQSLRLPSDEWTQNLAISAGLVIHF
ncbi:MAG: hypothetical protein L0271_04520 [Gemmatimonadetes bacterium]|nr:hypothetical protein [Gemmatimonadota bacterium]